jgi:hypothetical protein
MHQRKFQCVVSMAHDGLRPFPFRLSVIMYVRDGDRDLAPDGETMRQALLAPQPSASDRPPLAPRRAWGIGPWSIHPLLV